MSQAHTANAFAYVAVRAGGARKFGVRQARTPAALAESLRMDNQLLLRHWRLPAWAAHETGLGLKDHLILNEQLAQLLGRGVPLVEALEVAASTVRPGARARMTRLKELVASGSAFADACRTVGGFDNVTIAVYRGAERTGDLAGAAKQLAETARRRLAVSGKAATLMIYPAIVLSISVIVASLMLTLVVPRLGEALAQADIPLPVYSRVVMSTGTWMRDNAVWLLLGLAAVIAGLVVARAAVGAAVQASMRRLPLMRDVVVAQESARFFSVMAAMTRSGVTLAEALGVANGAVSHPLLRKQLERLRTRLIEGGMLRLLIEDVQALPMATRRLLIAAERSGDLETVFSTLAADMAAEVEKRSERLLAVMEPALIVTMFLIIGSLLMSIMLPMLTLSSRVGT